MIDKVIVISNKGKITIQLEKAELDDYIQSLQMLYLDAVNHKVTKIRIRQKDYKILDLLDLEKYVEEK